MELSLIFVLSLKPKAYEGSDLKKCERVYSNLHYIFFMWITMWITLFINLYKLIRFILYLCIVIKAKGLWRVGFQKNPIECTPTYMNILFR
jgi:hypothetical protein